MEWPSYSTKSTYHQRNAHQTCCTYNQSNLNGDNSIEEIKGIPLSADTIHRRITEMDQDIKFQLNDRVKRGKYALQLDASTDVSGLVQLIVR